MKISSNPLHTKENLINKYSTKSNLIYLVVILSVIGFGVSMPLIKVDVTSQSRAIVRSLYDDVPLFSVVSGRVEQVDLRNNQSVNKGDTLIVVYKNTLIAQKEILRKTIRTDSLILLDLEQATQNVFDSLKTKNIQEDYEKYTNNLNELITQRKQRRAIYLRNKTLFNKGVIAKAEFENYTYDYQQARQAVLSFKQNKISDWENQKRSLLEKHEQDKGSLKRLETEEDNYFITAPIDGVVTNFIGLQNQSFIQPQQTIAVISPQSDLIIESMVDPGDIGLLRENQNVKYQIDAFNYNQWGFVTGEVFEIDRNLTLDEQAAYFKVRSTLDKKELELDNGYKASIKKGMTLTSRFFITERSLYDLLFDKIDDWLNPKTNN